jgi:hypothetical protein
MHETLAAPDWLELLHDQMFMHEMRFTVNVVIICCLFVHLISQKAD